MLVETEELGVKPPLNYQNKSRTNKKMRITKIVGFLNGQTRPIRMRNSP